MEIENSWSEQRSRI